MGSKLEAADPYIFYAYEFRRFCILSKLIVIIGYSFSDLHINKMLVLTRCSCRLCAPPMTGDSL
jgi:hypothetical protein